MEATGAWPGATGGNVERSTPILRPCPGCSCQGRGREGARTSGMTREALSTEAACAGGPAGSSGEPAVMAGGGRGGGGPGRGVLLTRGVRGGGGGGGGGAREDGC